MTTEANRRATARCLRASALTGIVVCLWQQARADESGLAVLAPSGFAPPTVGQAGLGSPGPDVRIGDIRAFVDTVGAPQPLDRPFTFTPSIGLEELVTDNVLELARPRRADVVTSILPEIVISGQTPHLQANIVYAPRVQLYAQTSQQDQVVQDFNGQALLTAVPETLFLRLRGYATQQASNGASAQAGLPYLSRENRTDTLSFEISPYVTHRFGGYGTAQAGYVLNYSRQSGSTATAAQPLVNNGFVAGRPFNPNLVNGTTRSSEEYATLSSGENFGRFNDVLRLDATQYTSTGSSVLNRAHRTTAIDEFGYGVNRWVALLGSLGYEDIAYGGLPPVVIKDVVWSGGVRLTPNESSSLSLTYGHKDGFNALTLTSSYAVTARLRVFASYSEGLTSSTQELQDNLDNSTVDQFGNTISTVTGAPTLVADQLLAPQNTLYRLKRFSATAVSVYDRDSFSLTVEQEMRRLVSSGPGVTGFSDRGLSGIFTWRHDLTPDLSGSLLLRYSHDSGGGGSGASTDAAGVTLQTSYALTPTLSATIQYNFVNQWSGGGRAAPTISAFQQSFKQNTVILGLRKTL